MSLLNPAQVSPLSRKVFSRFFGAAECQERQPSGFHVGDTGRPYLETKCILCVSTSEDKGNVLEAHGKQVWFSWGDSRGIFGLHVNTAAVSGSRAVTSSHCQHPRWTV